MPIIESAYSNEVSATPRAAATAPVTGREVLVYEATSFDLNNGDAIASWPDQSGNALDLPLGTAATFVADVGNGTPAVHIPPKSAHLSSLPISGAAFADLIVIKPDTIATTGIRYWMDGDGRWNLREYAGAVQLGINSVQIAVTGDFTEPRLIVGISGGTTEADTVRIDGVDVPVGDLHGTYPAGGVILGGTHTTTSGTNQRGVIVQALVRLEAPTPAQVEEWELYLMSKYRQPA